MKFITTLFILIFMLAKSFAQSDSLMPLEEESEVEEAVVTEKRFNEKKWEELTKDVDFSEYKKAEKKKEEKPAPEPPSSFNFHLDSPILKVFFYLVIIAAFGFILYLIVRGIRSTPSNKEIQQENYTLEQAEENINESDLERLLQKALADHNYKLALRISYLMVLKELSQYQYIQWKKEKTNFEYLYEIKHQELRLQFKNITTTFERCWYGDTEVQHQEFQVMAPAFTQLIQTIKQKGVYEK